MNTAESLCAQKTWNSFSRIISKSYLAAMNPGFPSLQVFWGCHFWRFPSQPEELTGQATVRGPSDVRWIATMEDFKRI